MDPCVRKDDRRLPAPPVHRRHLDLGEIDAVEAADIDRDHLAPVGLGAAREHVDAAIDAELEVPGVWSVYACSTCRYAWRSTEPAENCDPDQYPAAFRLKPEDLPRLPVIPAIPPRRGK